MIRSVSLFVAPTMALALATGCSNQTTTTATKSPTAASSASRSGRGPSKEVGRLGPTAHTKAEQITVRRVHGTITALAETTPPAQATPHYFVFALNHLISHKTLTNPGADTIWARIKLYGRGGTAWQFWNGYQCSGGFPETQTNCVKTHEMNDSNAIVELCCTYASTTFPLYEGDKVTVQVTVVNQAHEPEPNYDGLLSTSYTNPNCYVGASDTINTTNGSSNVSPTTDCSAASDVWNNFKQIVGLKNCDGLVLNKIFTYQVTDLVNRHNSQASPTGYETDVAGPPANKTLCGQQSNYNIYISEFEISPQSTYGPITFYLRPVPVAQPGSGKIDKGDQKGVGAGSKGPRIKGLIEPPIKHPHKKPPYPTATP